MCVAGPMGLPLDDYTLERMGPAEQAFWQELFVEAKKAIEELNGRKPSGMPEKLKSLYDRALVEFDGSKYCPIQQLKQFFSL